MEELAFKIPPWPKEKRIWVAVILTMFILLTSGLIGWGGYQTSVEAGWVKQTFSKDSLFKSLLNDAEFIRTVKQQAQMRECVNGEQRFRLTFDPPLHLAQVENLFENCTKLITTHPTGSTTQVTLKREVQPRENLVMQMAQEFFSIQTEMIQGSVYETSVMSGNKNGILTTIYVVSVDQDTSWVIEYLPTSPLLDGKVLGLVKSFRLF